MLVLRVSVKVQAWFDLNLYLGGCSFSECRRSIALLLRKRSASKWAENLLFRPFYNVSPPPPNLAKLSSAAALLRLLNIRGGRTDGGGKPNRRRNEENEAATISGRWGRSPCFEFFRSFWTWGYSELGNLMVIYFKGLHLNCEKEVVI